MVMIDASIGELVDKVSILSIKLEKIRNEEKLKNVRREYDLLKKLMERIGITEKSMEFEDLKRVNVKLWEIEDQIRIKEAKKEFDDVFIDLARSVYFNNDRRAALKRNINIQYESELVEEKEYSNY